MLTHVMIEDIGADQRWMNQWSAILNDGKPLYKSRAWVAIISGWGEEYKYDRIFVNPMIDYSGANAVGSRGVFKHYYLTDGVVYQISEPRSWNRTDKYYCRFENGEKIIMSEAEVDQWLDEHSE